MPNIMQRIACKAVIIADGKLLIVREAVYDDGTNAGRYILPGGRIKPGEPYLQGLTREVLEETGLRVTPIAPLYVGEWFPVISGQHTQIVAVFFACQATTQQVRLGAEHDAYVWISPQDYPQYDLVVPEEEVVRAYLRYRAVGLVT